LLLARFFDEALTFLPSASVDAFHDDLGLSYSRIGVVLALPAIGGILGGAASVAADRHSRRVIASAGSFGMAGSMLIYACAPSFGLLCVAAVLLGLASTALIDGTEVALVDVAGDGLRTALARADLLATGGDLAGPAMFAIAVAIGSGWRGAFVIGALLGAGYGALLASLPIPPPADVDDREPLLQSLRSVARDGRVWRLAFIGICLNPLDEPFVGFVIAHAHGASWAPSLIAGGFVVGGVVGLTIVTRLGSGRPDRVVCRIAAVLMLVAIALVTFTASPFVAVAGGAVFAIGMALLWITIQHRELVLLPGQAGAVTAVVAVLELFGFAVPVGIGALADRAGLGAAVAAHALLPLLVLWLAGGLADDS
jgi:FSR family fosmidomycin resistance protein-like MFS transporter